MRNVAKTVDLPLPGQPVNRTSMKIVEKKREGVEGGVSQYCQYYGYYYRCYC